MAARLDAPVLGAFDDVTGGPGRWQISLSSRAQTSDRHFRGIHEEPNRQEEGSEVINDLYLLDMGVRYNFDARNSLSLGIPLQTADRSLPIRDDDRNVIGRSVMESDGVGDIVLTGSRLLFAPTKGRRGNVSLSLGIKFPTGDEGSTDSRARYVDGEIVETVVSNDQSIQAGDGGWGAVFGISGYRLLNHSGTLAAYGSGTYLFNPETTNGVETGRRRESEAIMSVADQYLARAGLQVAPLGWKGVSFGLGGRIEGVPVYDVFGSSEGFRRPGYAVSVEPSIAWQKGKTSLSLAVPVALQRNRQRSVPDRMEEGRHGDAAFADYIVLLGFWYRL